MANFGEKIRLLRTKQGISKLAFCDDETELTVRQLRRIENEGVKPTFEKLKFIANRLGVPAYQLMPDYKELSKDYLELKYLILRTPVYANEKVRDTVETYLDCIYETYYEDLPEEEKLVIDIASSNLDVITTKNPNFLIDIFDDYFAQVRSKKSFSINDLLILSSFIFKASLNLPHIANENLATFNAIKYTLLEQNDTIDPSDLFIYRDTLIHFASIAYYTKDNDYLEAALIKLNQLMEKSQDFQKKSIIDMLNWKLHLNLGHYDEAEEKFKEAISFAKLINHSHLIEQLEMTWEYDKTQLSL